MRWLLALCALAAFMLAPCGFALGSEPPAVFVDGEELAVEVPPMIENGRTLVPMRAIFEALGAELTWDAANQRIVVYKKWGSLDDVWVQLALWVGSTKVWEQRCNGTGSPESHWTELEVPPKIVNGRTLVPLRFVSEALWARVDWVPEEWAAYIWSREWIMSNVEVAQIPEDYYYVPENAMWYGNTLEELKTLLRYGLRNIPSYYEMDVFDCSQSAAYVEQVLETVGFDARIAVGEMFGSYHAWVIVCCKDGVVAVEATRLLCTQSVLEEWWNQINWLVGFAPGLTTDSAYFRYKALYDDIVDAVRDWGIEEWDWWTVLKERGYPTGIPSVDNQQTN